MQEYQVEKVSLEVEKISADLRLWWYAFQADKEVLVCHRWPYHPASNYKR